MLAPLGGMMNMFPWSTKLLMQVGRSKLPFKSLPHPKVSNIYFYGEKKKEKKFQFSYISRFTNLLCECDFISLS